MDRRMLVLLGLTLWTLTACDVILSRSAKDYPPQTLTVALPVAPEVAYQRAYKAFARMPAGTIRTADATMHYLGGEVNQVVRLTVLVEPQGTGALVTINGSVLPGRPVRGEFDEVQRYAQVLKETQ